MMKRGSSVVVLHDGSLKTAMVLSSEEGHVVICLQSGYIYEVSKMVIVQRTDSETLKLLEDLVVNDNQQFIL